MLARCDPNRSQRRVDNVISANNVNRKVFFDVQMAEKSNSNANTQAVDARQIIRPSRDRISVG